MPRRDGSVAQGCGGRCRGWRHQYYATGLTGWQRGEHRRWPSQSNALANDELLSTREQVLSMLHADLRCLEQSLERLRRRIGELNAQETKKTSS